MTLGVRPGRVGRVLLGIGQHDVPAFAHGSLYEDARHSLHSLGPFWRSGILLLRYPPRMMTYDLEPHGLSWLGLRGYLTLFMF